MNRKGFTLIELLGVIVIIGLVLGISSFGIIKIYNNSKDNATKLSYESLKKAAIEYAGEFRNGNNYWNKYDSENMYACTTIKAMKNKGFFKKNASLYDENKNLLSDDSYIMIIRNNLTKEYSDILIDNSKCGERFDINFLFEPNGTKGDNDWWKDLSIKYETIIDDVSKIDNISYFIVNNNQRGNTTSGNLNEQIVKINDNSIKTKLCLIAEGKNGKIVEKCSNNYKLDSIPPTSPNIKINNFGNIVIDGSTDNISPSITYLSSNDNSNYVSGVVNVSSNETIYAKAKDEAGNESNNISKTYIEENSLTGTVTEIDGYKCSADGKIYRSDEEARKACTKIDSTKAVSKEITTYSCPSGFYCSGGTCNSKSSCIKEIKGTIKEMYYCSHDNSYQSSSTCSYTGWEKGTLDLKCATSQSCYNYNYCSSGTYSNGNCWLWNRTSCPSGWSKIATGSCNFSCSFGNVLLYSKCSGTATCSSSGHYSCISSCAGINDPNCRSGYQLPGRGSCHTTATYYNCYKSPNVGKSCSTVGHYTSGSYTNRCRDAGAYDVSNVIKCNLNDYENPEYPTGTVSCLSGYHVSERTLYTNCPDWLKITAADGKKYCNTADYHQGRTCNSNIGSGATAVYNLTCSKTGVEKYYCDANQTYYNSKPSSCKKNIEEEVIASKSTIYVCPEGYSTTTTSINQNTTCTKSVSIGDVTKLSNKIYTCSLDNTINYTDRDMAKNVCTNHCPNSKTKFYSAKNKCIGLDN